MKQVNFFTLSGMLFTFLLAACNKETEKKRSNSQSSEPTYYFSKSLQRKAYEFATERGYFVKTKKDSLLFFDPKFSPVLNDTAKYYKFCDSIAREIVKNVYVESIQKLPERWYQSNIPYYSLENGYYYTITSYYENGTYKVFNTYYSESGNSKGFPHGSNPFAFTAQYVDTVLNVNGDMYRGYNPGDWQKFPL